MVTAICAWRRICMTSRGCTSRSTNSVAQVRLPSCTVIFRTPALTNDCGTPSCAATIPETTNDEEITVSCTYRVLVQRHGHLLYLDIPRPTKGLQVQLWYGDCGIRRVNTVDFIASAQEPRILRSPASVPTPSVEVGFDGWIFPKSGVAFVWVLESEIGGKNGPSYQDSEQSRV
jgi:hypothetical protein